MAADDNDNTIETDDEPSIEEGDPAQDAQSEQMAALQKAASEIELVVLPLSCTNEGKGAPLSMGVQRWLAQELARTGLKAAAPVFTAIAEQQGRKVPALLIYRDAWTDQRALQGATRFANARRVLIGDFNVAEDKLGLQLRLADLHLDAAATSEPEHKPDAGEAAAAEATEGGEDEEAEEKVPGRLETVKEWSLETTADGLGTTLFEALQHVAAAGGQTVTHTSWEQAFGTKDKQAMLSFLVGLGNLSALQGRTVPATADQLLNPLMDAINRDPKLDGAMEALHAMTDMLMALQPDRSAVPLSVGARSASTSAALARLRGASGTR
jgi:hypothetical protein